MSAEKIIELMSNAQFEANEKGVTIFIVKNGDTIQKAEHPLGRKVLEWVRPTIKTGLFGMKL